MTLPVSRAQALRQNSTYYFNGKVCLRGHVSKRNTKNWTCCECAAFDQQLAHEKRRSLSVAYKVERKQRRRQATPPWYDDDAVQKFYDQAARLTEKTGISHEVDHIVPLTSEFVCGLHVQDNLQVLTSFENNSKGNRYWPGMEWVIA